MSVFKPKKPPKPPALPAQPQLEDTGRAAEDAVRREQRKRGYAAQLLTGGEAGLGTRLGPIGTTMLLGRAA